MEIFAVKNLKSGLFLVFYNKILKIFCVLKIKFYICHIRNKATKIRLVAN